MEMQKIEIKLNSLSDIMFDRFYDHSKAERPPEQKMYIEGDNNVILPSENLYAFLFGQNPAGCAKAFEGKTSKDYLRVGPGHVFIDPGIIPFTNGTGKGIQFKDFDSKQFYVYEAAPRTKQGSLSIKQEMNRRPALKHPWSLNFIATIVKNPWIDEQKLYNWFSQGGILIGLGNNRPRFGRFQIDKWETI